MNALCGVWMVFSAFSWHHTAASQANSWIVGLLMFLFAVAAVYEPSVRWANTVLAVWLGLSSLTFFHESSSTAWNNLIVAGIVFIASLVPSRALGMDRRWPRPV